MMPVIFKTQSVQQFAHQ